MRGHTRPLGALLSLLGALVQGCRGYLLSTNSPTACPPQGHLGTYLSVGPSLILKSCSPAALPLPPTWTSPLGVRR